MSGCCNSGGGCGCEGGGGGAGALRWIIPLVLIGAVVAVAVLRSPAKPQDASAPQPVTTPDQTAAMAPAGADTGTVVAFADWKFQVIEASKIRPVLVDFNATWCPPCQLLKPVIEQYAKANAATVSVVAIDTDQHAEVARQNGVQGIPDLRLFVNGAQVAARTGYVDGEGLSAWVAANLTR